MCWFFAECRHQPVLSCSVLPLYVKTYIKDQDKCFDMYPKKRFYDLFADRMVMMKPLA